MNPTWWAICRLWVRIRRGRVPPPSVPDPVWYFAYGSNMNERLFRERRHMTRIETRIGRLENHRLCFSVADGMRPGVSAPANITDDPGSTVYGVLYSCLCASSFGSTPAKGRNTAIFGPQPRMPKATHCRWSPTSCGGRHQKGGRLYATSISCERRRGSAG